MIGSRLPRYCLLAVGALTASTGLVAVTATPAAAVTTTFTNATTITIPSAGAASPYPSQVTVSGMPGTLNSVTVTLTGITHSSIDDVGVLLVDPQGNALLVMDGVGDGVPVSGVNLTFDDAAASALPNSGTPVTGTFRPAAYYLDDSFPAPAPSANYSAPTGVGLASLGSTFVGENPNGSWSLYVVDFAGPASGSVASGWSLTVTSETPSGATSTPSVTGVTPGSSGQTTVPKIKGNAPAGSTVSLFNNATCAGGAIGTGTATEYAGAGITAVVPGTQATTTIYAQARKAGESVSACSSTFVSYTRDTVAPAVPTLTGVSPASGSTSTTPAVKGTAEAGSTVTLFKTADCSGAAAATGTAATFGAAGIPASVVAGSTTTFKAKATDAAGNVSACSATSVAYTHVPPPVPDTTLTATPKKKVKTSKRKAKVSFSFSSPTAGATFECSVDGKAFAVCTTGQTFKLNVGKHTFAVRAVAGGQTDPTPATYAFKIKQKR